MLYWHIALSQKIHLCSKIFPSGCTKVLKTMYVAQCEQDFQVTPCRLMWIIHFSRSFASAKTAREPCHYKNWRFLASARPKLNFSWVSYRWHCNFRVMNSKAFSSRELVTLDPGISLPLQRDLRKSKRIPRQQHFSVLLWRNQAVIFQWVKKEKFTSKHPMIYLVFSNAYHFEES